MLTLFKQTNLNLTVLNAAILFVGIAAVYSNTLCAGTLTEAITSGKATVDVRWRYENVNTDGKTPSSSDAMTMRTRVGYTSADYQGFSATVEFEDVRDMFGIQDEAGFISDNEVTELEQGFLQYKDDAITAKFGRQLIVHDNHRQLGDVGWRQDRQTFDAARLISSPVENMTIDLAYIYRRNGVNGSVLDTPNPDYKVANIAYKTPVGQVSAYSYLLTKEGDLDKTNTYGARFTGKAKGEVTFLYTLEYAIQDNKTKDVDTTYTLLEAGVSVAGVTGKLGHEVLASDTKNGVTENFSTPLATVHKFQGWADVFLGGSVIGTIDGGNGLADTYLSLATKVNGVSLLAVYHDYESDAGSTNLGNELNVLAAKKLTQYFNIGVKYAKYSKGDINADVDKFWLWVGMAF